jgi:hypothetical protein
LGISHSHTHTQNHRWPQDRPLFLLFFNKRAEDSPHQKKTKRQKKTKGHDKKYNTFILLGEKKKKKRKEKKQKEKA